MNRIIELAVSNFKRIKVASIRPGEGGAVRISGRNGSGKSSLLDAIQVALEGKRAMPATPVRAGEEQSEIVIDCGDVLIRRRISPDGSGTLKITTKDGMSPAKPQAWLDERIGAIAFQPLSFLALDGKEQADTIRRLASCDVSDLDAERERVYEERTSIRRDLKNAESMLANVAPLAAVVPDVELSTAEVLGEIEAAQDAERHRTELKSRQAQIAMRVSIHESGARDDRAAYEMIESDHRAECERIQRSFEKSADDWTRRLARLSDETLQSIQAAEAELDAVILELEARLAAVRSRRAAVGPELLAKSEAERSALSGDIASGGQSLERALRAVDEKYQTRVYALDGRVAKRALEMEADVREHARLEAEINAIGVGDVVALREKLRDVESTNRLVRAQAERRALAARVEHLQSEVDRRTQRLDEVAAERQSRIAAVKYPIDGLGFGADGKLTFNGLPLKQASTAEQIRVSMSIGLALNPEFRVVLLRDASLLDEDSMALVCEMAERADAQVWLERCSVDGVEGEIVIEDGEVRS